MCSCEFNFTCARHREPSPDLPDGDDPYNDQPADPHVSEYEVTASRSESETRVWNVFYDPENVFQVHAQSAVEAEQAALGDPLWGPGWAYVEETYEPAR